MTYFISDIHGEYDLFCRLLDKINFSDSDTLMILGDMIDKGNGSIRVLNKVCSMNNAISILGNHEYDFLKLYWAKMRNATSDFDKVLSELQAYFPNDREPLTWDLLDFLESLPTYITNEKYIAVHAGVPLERDGTIKPLDQAFTEQFVYDRNFKNPTTVVNDKRTVLYGHTPTSYLNGTGEIILYPRSDGNGYSRVHLDTGVYLTGIMGCFCFESGQCFYVKNNY